MIKGRLARRAAQFVNELGSDREELAFDTGLRRNAIRCLA
jgi:hypothetical protein